MWKFKKRFFFPVVALVTRCVWDTHTNAYNGGMHCCSYINYGHDSYFFVTWRIDACINIIHRFIHILRTLRILYLIMHLVSIFHIWLTGACIGITHQNDPFFCFKADRCSYNIYMMGHYLLLNIDVYNRFDAMVCVVIMHIVIIWNNK